jgi:hypothetical protein
MQLMHSIDGFTRVMLGYNRRVVWYQGGSVLCMVLCGFLAFYQSLDVQHHRLQQYVGRYLMPNSVFPLARAGHLRNCLHTSTISRHVSGSRLVLVPPPRRDTRMKMSFASQLSDVDDKIRVLEQLLLLKQRRNSLVPICRLPVELLARILAFLQHFELVHPHGGADFLFHSNANNWSQFMLVCAHFRAVAVQTPALWNVYDFARPVSEWRELCLSRAAGISSCIRINSALGVGHLRQAWKAVVTDAAVHPDVLDACVTPELRVLVLHLLASSYNPKYEIKQSFLGGAPLSLTHFKIVGDRIALNAHLRMPLLRCLWVQGITTSLDTEAWASLFRHSPLLEEVSINGVFLQQTAAPLNVATVVPVPARVLLPCLSTLSLSNYLAEAAAFARLLPAPSAMLRITVAEGHQDVPMGSNIVSIHEAYARFLDALTDDEGLSRCRVTIGNACAYDTIEFGQSLPGQYIERSPYPASFFTFMVMADDHHPLFDLVTIVRIVASSSFLDLPSKSRLFPNMHTLLLEELKEVAVDSDEYIEFTTWLVQCAGRIKRIEFHSCRPAFLPLFGRLQKEQTMSVLWLPRMRKEGRKEVLTMDEDWQVRPDDPR